MRLPFFRRVRQRSEASPLVRMRGRGRPTEPPPAQPRELVDVVAVGATETAGGIALTLLSVERYVEGEVALFRLLRRRGPLERDFLSPYLEIGVLPEGDRPVRVCMMGGSGGGGPGGEVEHRMSYAIVPRPAPGVHIIEVRRITWERHGPSGPPSVARVDAGPWRFAIGG